MGPPLNNPVCGMHTWQFTRPNWKKKNMSLHMVRKYTPLFTQPVLVTLTPSMQPNNQRRPEKDMDQTVGTSWPWKEGKSQSI